MTYLRLVLYAPGLGYYSAGSAKFGRRRGFRDRTGALGAVRRAWRVSARRCCSSAGGEVLELGAGSAALAAGCS